MTVKNIINGITVASIAAMFAITTGCTSLPTTTEMSDLGFASGYTTAYVLNNQVTVDDVTRNAIIDIMTEAEKYIPATNETFAATWTPIAQKYVDKLVKEDKITQTVADRVMKDFGYVTNLLDQYLEKKGVRQYQDLVDAFIHSFCRSFLTNFKPANGTLSAAPCKIDEDTQKILMSVINSAK